MLKILQAMLQRYMNQELSDFQSGFRKGREIRDQIANIYWITEKAREFQKTSTSALLTMLIPLTVWITINCGKFWNRREYQITWPASWEICMQVKKKQNWTGDNRLFPKRKRNVSRLLFFVTQLILLICRVHQAKCQAGLSTSWNQDCCEKYQ